MPVVVTTISVCDWRVDKFISFDVVEASDIDAVEFAELWRVSQAKRAYAAVLAEEMMVVSCVEEVFSQL